MPRTGQKKVKQRTPEPCLDLPLPGFDEPEVELGDYIDRVRKCGRCRDEFLSNAGELKARGVLFIPLFCQSCDWLNGVELTDRTRRWRDRMRRGEIRWKARGFGWEKVPPRSEATLGVRPR